MAVEWEWLGDYQLERQIEVTPLLSADNTNHGGSVVHEEYGPTETLEFVAKGLTWAEVETLINEAKVRKATKTITDKFARSWTGYVTFLKPTPIDGTVLHSVRITLLIPPPVPTP
jgi:hypothetical protein